MPLPMVWISCSNTGPVAGDDAASVEAGQSVVIDVLANDTDADGDALTVTGISVGPSHGTVTVNQDGTLSYVAADGYAGDDVFTYQISDGNGGVSEATVTVSVTAPPPPSTGGETIAGTDYGDFLLRSLAGVECGEPDPDGRCGEGHWQQ